MHGDPTGKELTNFHATSLTHSSRSSACHLLRRRQAHLVLLASAQALWAWALQNFCGLAASLDVKVQGCAQLEALL